MNLTRYANAFDYLRDLIANDCPTEPDRRILWMDVFRPLTPPPIDLSGDARAAATRMLQAAIQFGQIPENGEAILVLCQQLQRRHGVNYQGPIAEAGQALLQTNDDTLHFGGQGAALHHRGVQPHIPDPPRRPQVNLDGLRTAADMMSRRVLTITADKTIQDAGSYMFGSGTTYLAVVGGQNRFMGWISQGDVIEKLPPFLSPHLLGRELTPEEQAQFNSLLKERSDTPITEIMYSIGSERRRLIFFAADTPLDKVVERFITPVTLGGQAHYAFLRKLPVLSVDHNHVEGVLGYWMVVSKLIAARLIPNVLVGDCMLSANDPSYVRILDSDTITKVSWQARQHGWSYIAITDRDGKLAGMTSIEQIKRAIDHDLAVMRERPIRDVMRPASECTLIRAADPLEKWLRIFADDDIGALPVVNGEGKLEGLLNYVSVLRAYRDYLFRTE